MDKPKVTPKDFFLWAGAMVSLYVSVFSFISLIFDYINYTFPDPLQYFPTNPYSGSISYERRNFIPTILQQNGEALTLFDGNTTFSGELVVPVPNAPFLRLAVMFSTTIARDDAGEIVLDVNGNPQMWPLITLETRLSF